MIILCKVTSGMCNRLIPYLTCIRLTKILNAKMYVLWDNNCADCDYNYIGEKTTYDMMFENIENINFIDNNEYNKLYSSSQNRLNINYMMEKSISQYSFEELKDFDILNFFSYTFPIFTKDSNISFETYSDCHWLNTLNKEYYESFRLLRPKQHIQNKIDNVLKNFSNYNNMIGIHLRHWPNNWLKKNYNLIEGNESIRIEYMKNAIKNNNDIKFFISSTDYNSIQDLIKIFKERIIYFKDRFGNCDDHKYYTNDQSSSSSNIYKNFNGVVDLFLLSRCKIIFGDVSSSFSVCACLLNEKCKFNSTITGKK